MRIDASICADTQGSILRLEGEKDLETKLKE